MSLPEPWDRIPGHLPELLRQGLEAAVSSEPVEKSTRLLLDGLISLTGSRAGCSGEVMPGANGTPDCKVHASSARIAGRAEFLSPATGPVLQELSSIFNRVILSGKLVVDDGSAPTRFENLSGGNSFIGLPVLQGPALVGAIVLTGRPGGYGETSTAVLAPVVAAYAAIIEIARLRNRQRRMAEELKTGRAQADQLADLGEQLRSCFDSLLKRAQGSDGHPNPDKTPSNTAHGMPSPGAGQENPTPSPYGPQRAESSMAGRHHPASVPGLNPPEARESRILVVEDFPPNRALLRMQIETLGFTSDTASTGSEALAKWQAGHYDLILADINLPGMSGLELTRAVRQHENLRGSRTPIVAITAAVEPEKGDACRAAGMDDVLIKPIEMDALRNVLGRWLAGAPRTFAPAPDVVLEPDIIELFNNSTRQLLAECHPLLRQGDGRGLADAMHKLKSSAASLGARRMSALAVALEEAAQKGRWPEADALLGELDGAMAEFETAAARMPPPLPSASSGESGYQVSGDDVREAILHDEFEVEFQPEVSATAFNPVAVKAVARWSSDRHGDVPAEVFIAVAEQHTLIGPLSEMLLSKALFGGTLLGKAGFSIALEISLSTFCLLQPRLTDLILASIRAAGIPAERVILEFTEVGAMVAINSPSEFTRLRQQGIHFTMDDFGTDGSSPDRLSRMGFDRLKLSRETLRSAAGASAPTGLKVMLERARHLAFTSVAEGVETEEDLAMARTLGCDCIQGSLIAEAMPIETLIHWLQTWNPVPKPMETPLWSSSR